LRAVSDEACNRPFFKIAREFKIGLVNDDESTFGKFVDEIDELYGFADRAGRVMRVDEINCARLGVDLGGDSREVIFKPTVERDPDNDTAGGRNSIY
jgi:hypothetical protein